MRHASAIMQYQIKYRHFGRQKFEHFYGETTIDLEFREVSRTDVRSVARIQNQGGPRYNEPGAVRFIGSSEYQPPPAELIHFEDDFWYEAGDFAAFAAHLENGGPDDFNPFAETYRWNKYVDRENLTTLDQEIRENPKAKHFESLEQSTADLMIKKAAEIIIVDGRVYEKVGEPYLQVFPSYADEGATIRIHGLSLFENEPQGRPLVKNGATGDKWLAIPVDCTSERLDGMDRLLERWAGAGKPVKIGCAVEVFEPGVFRQARQQKEAIKGTNVLLNTMIKHLYLLDYEDAARTLVLRDAWQRSGMRMTAEVVDALQGMQEAGSGRSAVRRAVFDKEEMHIGDGWSGGRISRQEIDRIVDAASQRARDLLLTLSNELPGLGLDLDIATPSMDWPNGRVREVRSPEDVRDLAADVGLSVGQLDAVIADGGHLFRVETGKIDSPELLGAFGIDSDRNVQFHVGARGADLFSPSVAAVAERMSEHFQATSGNPGSRL